LEGYFCFGKTEIKTINDTGKINLMNEPLISVIIVVFNAKKTIKDTIDSILEQTYRNIEIVIIDGKSNDGTIEVVKGYANKVGYFISEKDNGVYDAMNKGIIASKGEWIIFLGADDVFIDVNVLSSIFISKKHDEIDFLYGDVILTSNQKVYGGERTYMSLVDKNICHQSIFYKKTIFEKIGKYNLSYKILSDFDFNIRVFENSKLKKQYINQTISLYNNKGLSSYTLDKEFHTHILNTFLKDNKNPFFTPELQQHHFYYGIINLCDRNLLMALKHIITSWLCGKRKLFYFLFTGKFLLRIFSFQKIKIK
jgi:glycosyltransferase involved in cell wall biosynthesis